MIFLYIFLFLLFVLLVFSYRYKLKYEELKKLAKVEAEKQAEIIPRKFEDAFLQSKRSNTDAYADEVIRQIMEHGEEDQVNHLFRFLMKNDELISKDTHPEILEYFKKTSILPDWANKDMMAFGQENYIRHGLLIGMILFYKALPECYTGAKGAEVLMMSGKLNENNPVDERFSKRMAETALFIFNIMMPGGFDKDGKGVVAAQKVRLMHAVIRYHLKKHGRWNSELFDEPINQEDMTGTLISFSGLIALGLEMIGADLDSIEAESYIHCWSVIGHIMGVEEDMIPRNLKEAISLGYGILDHQKKKSEAGHSLTKALLNFCERKGPPFIHREFHLTMMRFFIEPEYCEILNLPAIEQAKIDRLSGYIHIYVRFREFLENKAILALPIKIIDAKLLSLSIKYLSNNKLLHFYLPKSFNKD